MESPLYLKYETCDDNWDDVVKIDEHEIKYVREFTLYVIFEIKNFLY